MTMSFRTSWIPHAIWAAKKSACAKSRRGVVIFSGAGLHEYDGALVGRGWNGPPEPFKCGKNNSCRQACNKVSIHAEEMALLDAGRHARFGSMLHVKIDEDDEVVASGPPSCWQCSRMILNAGIEYMWLIHKDGPKRYSAVDFHQATLEHCDLPISRVDRCDECGGKTEVFLGDLSEHAADCSRLPL